MTKQTNKTCPNCRRELPADWTGDECPFCGIIFARFLVSLKKGRRDSSAADYRPPGSERSTASAERQPPPRSTDAVKADDGDNPLYPAKTPPSDDDDDNPLYSGATDTDPGDSSAPSSGYAEAVYHTRTAEPQFTIELDDEPDQKFSLKGWWRDHRETIALWAEEKSPIGYSLVLLLMVYWAVRYTIDPTYHSLFDGINLGIHEMGHVIFSFMGTFIMFAGGTFLQLAAPFACIIYFHMRGEYVGSGFAATWFGANCYNVAIYVADATDQFLDLVTVGGGVPIHDWNYMLGKLGLLGTEHILAWLIRLVGLVFLWGGVVYTIWLIKQTVTKPSSEG